MSKRIFTAPFDGDEARAGSLTLHIIRNRKQQTKPHDPYRASANADTKNKQAPTPAIKRAKTPTRAIKRDNKQQAQLLASAKTNSNEAIRPHKLQFGHQADKTPIAGRCSWPEGEV
jgi:hypothetical protein